MYHAYIYIYIQSIYIYNQCVYKYHIHICTHYDKVHLKQWISTMVFRQGTWQKNSWFWKPQVCGSNLHTSMRWFCTTSDWMMASCNWDKARLVGGLEHFGFFHIMGVIIPTDELIFFRGVGQPPTSRNWLDVPTRATGRHILHLQITSPYFCGLDPIITSQDSSTMGMKQNQAIMRKNNINCTYIYNYIISIYIYILYRCIVDEFSRFFRFDFRHGPP